MFGFFNRKKKDPLPEVGPTPAYLEEFFKTYKTERFEEIGDELVRIIENKGEPLNFDEFYIFANNNIRNNDDHFFILSDHIETVFGHNFMKASMFEEFMEDLMDTLDPDDENPKFCFAPIIVAGKNDLLVICGFFICPASNEAKAKEFSEGLVPVLNKFIGGIFGAENVSIELIEV